MGNDKYIYAIYINCSALKKYQNITKYILQIQNTTTRGVLLQTSPAINDDDEQQPSTSSSDYTTTADNDTDELDEESNENQLRGLMYDSCLQPENIAASASGNTIFSIAPGEGRLPTQILQDEDNEVCNNNNIYMEVIFISELLISLDFCKKRIRHN